MEPLTQEQFNFLPENQRKSAFSLHKIETVIEVMNEGHVFDWNNFNEYKYYPCWDMETYGDAPAGSGFAFGVFVCDRVYSCVGARLCLRTSAHVEHVAKIMFEDYRNWIKK